MLIFFLYELIYQIFLMDENNSIDIYIYVNFLMAL